MTNIRRLRLGVRQFGARLGARCARPQPPAERARIRHSSFIVFFRSSIVIACSLSPLWPPSAVAQDVALELLQSGAAARHFSGIYPHLASFNSQGECGTGAVVPWAGTSLVGDLLAPHAARFG